MTKSDRRRHKKMIKQFGKFADAYNKYNRYASQKDKLNVNLSKITEDLFDPCEAIK